MQCLFNVHMNGQYCTHRAYTTHNGVGVCACVSKTQRSQHETKYALNASSSSSSSFPCYMLKAIIRFISIYRLSFGLKIYIYVAASCVFVHSIAHLNSVIHIKAKCLSKSYIKISSPIFPERNLVDGLHKLFTNQTNRYMVLLPVCRKIASDKYFRSTVCVCVCAYSVQDQHYIGVLENTVWIFSVDPILMGKLFALILHYIRYTCFKSKIF